MIRRYFEAALFAGALATPAAAEQRCLDSKLSQPIQLTGTLTRKVFPGPPNFEDVRKGDAPEPGYILRLRKPICITGDDFIEQDKLVERVQIFPDYAKRQDKALARELRGSVGKRVVVEGASPFGAHTGHHHAPVLLPITRIMPASDNR
jgi:hypothetical protein